MKGRIAIGALVASALALPVPATATGGSVRMTALTSPSPASYYASVPEEQQVGQVPVPGTVALLALGGVGLSIVRRVKSRKRRD